MYRFNQKSITMKKIFTFIFAIALSLNVFAQCPYTTAFDFQAVDCHGTQVNLFEILDGGQYVLIDFFFTTCGPCQQATPKIVESYYAFGCNMHDVYYMEISTSDGDAACQTWAANYGVEYPTISTAGGGGTICNTYGISQYPTVILIAPDRSIVIQDLWPINNAQTVISALENHGIQQHDCEPGPIGEVEISKDTLYVYQGCVPGPDHFIITNNTLENVEILGYSSEEFDVDCTSSTGDIVGVTIEPSESLSVEVWAYPGRDNIIIEGTLILNTSYGDFELTVIWEDVGASVDEYGAKMFTLYPNPAKDYLMINGENLGNVSIFNAFGQKIAEYVASDELNIATSNYENGVYFVKVGDKTQRFVVTH